MGKYLGLWEMDPTRVPIDPVERGNLWLMMTAMVRQDMEKGLVKEWGTFVGEINGYFVAEGTEVEVSLMTQQYVPYARFKFHAAISVDKVEEIAKSLAGK